MKNMYFEPADRGEISQNELLQNLSEFSRKSVEEVSEELHGFVRVDAGMVELLTYLKKDHALGLCSNGVSEFVRPILEAHALLDLFDAVVISSEHGVIKPDPRMYRLALERLSADPREAVFIDDNPENVRGAERAGIRSILFTDQSALVSELTKLLGVPKER